MVALGVAVFVSGATVAGTTTLQTLTVDDDGGADYETIQQAVREAAPGDTIEVRPGTYREEVLIDKTITVVAPDGATLNGSTLEGDPVGITIEEAAAPTVSGLTVTGYYRGVDARGSGPDNPASSGDWTLRDLVVQNTSFGAVDASGSTGDWTIADSTLVDERNDALDAADATGDWTITDSTLTGRVFASNTNGRWTIEGSVVDGSSGGGGVVARESDSAWTIRNTTVRDARLDGVSARSSSGAWTIRNATILNTSQDGVGAYESSGDWTIRDTVVRNSTDDGVNAGSASGDWTILNATIRDNGATGVTGARTSGSWEVHESAIFDNGLGLDGFESDPAGEATRNWWGACDGPSGDFDGSGARVFENVVVAPFYTDAARTTLSNEIDSPCGPAPFDFDVELDEESETVPRGGDVGISTSFINNADRPVSGTTVELLVDTDDDGQFAADEVVAARTTDFGALEVRVIDFEYTDVQLTPESGPYRYAARIRNDGNTARSSTNGTLTVGSANQPPVARIAANRTVVSGVSSGVALDASNASDPDGAIESYAWDLDGDGDPEAFGTDLTTAFARPADDPTTVRVELTVTDDDGAVDTARLLVTVAPEKNQPPTAAFSQSPSLPDLGTNVTLNATASSDADGGIDSYTWDLDGDGSTDATGRMVTRNVSTITANATLTVTDDDGATDTVSKEVPTRSLQQGSGTFPVDGTTTYINEGPRVDFSVSPRKPEPGDTIRFVSETFDPDGTIEEHIWYVNGTEGQFLDSVFGTVDDTLVLASARGSLSAGTYNVTLVANDSAGDTSRATKLITVRNRQDDPTVNVQFRGLGDNPSEKILVGETVEFQADAQAVTGRSVDSIEWAFIGADDVELSGSSVVTSFSSTGTAAFTLEVEDSAGETTSVLETIEVDPPGEVPTITGVDADKEGSTLEGAPIDNTYTASIEAGDDIDRVEFELAGQTKTDRTGSDDWTGTFDLGRLNSDATLTVTVVDSDGDRDTATHRVDVVRAPGWVDGLINTGTVNVEQSRTKIVVTREIPDPPIDVDVSPPDDAPLISELDVFKLVIRSEPKLVYVMPATTARFDGSGTFEAALVDQSINLDVSADGRINIDDDENWKLKELQVLAEGGASPPPKGGSASVGPVKVTAEIEYETRARLGARLEDRDGTLALAGGELGVGVVVKRARATAGATGLPCDAGLKVDQGELSGKIAFTTNPFALEPGVTYLIDGEVGLIGPFCPAFQFSADGTVGASSATLGLQALDAGDLEVASTARLGTPPAEEGDAAATLGIEGRPQSIVTGARLTEDDVSDGPPALAYGNGTYTAIWARQDTDSSTGETDVYAATSTDDGWTAPAALNDSQGTVFSPDVAAAADHRAAVWTRAPTPTGDTTVTQLLANASIEVAIDDGSGWAAPARFEEGNGSRPVVAVDDGRALVAWVRDPDGNSTTTTDRQVRWTVHDGSFGPVRTVPNATAVDVAGGPDGISLVYFESDDGENGSVVRADLASGSLVQSDSYSATGVTDVSAGSRATAWGTSDDDGVVLRHAADGQVTTAPTDDVVGVDDIELLDDAGQPVVVYSGLPLNGSGTSVFAQRRAGNGWLPPERITAAGEGNLTAVGLGAAAGENEVGAVLGLTNLSAPGHPDVFAARQSFTPDLTITARTGADVDNATAGDRVTVNYTVRNVGGRATTADATVALDTTGGTVATRTHRPLAPGERATGSVTVRVGTGPTLRVDPSDAISESDESNNAVPAARARPDLTVEDITQRRTGEDVIVTATIRNGGAVAIANATVALRVGNVTLTQRRVDVDATGRRHVRLQVQRDAVNRSLTDAVVVDPDDRIPERDERNNVGSLRLLAVDLALSESVGTTDAPGGVLAEAFVSNAGPGDARAAVTVAGAGSDTGLTYDLPIEGTSDSRVFERVRLYHPTTDGTLDLAVDPRTGADANGLDNVATTTASASANDTAPVRVTGVDATAANGTVTVTATLRTDADVATGVPVTASAGGTIVAERTAVVPANDSRTVELNGSRGATSLTVATPGSQMTTDLPAAPDVTGDGRPATSIDDDPLLEDVDGDGEFSIGDVQIFFQNRDADIVQNNAEFFNFDGQEPPGVSIGDVQALFQLFQEHG